jgi:phosphoribosylformimino-5-aminoimidazole carboxamide ribotide isomerase
MTSFTIYPAIDMRVGQVVRLKEGNPARQTTYSPDPSQTAQNWLAAGARWLHVVNLDGAFAENDMANQEALRAILDVANAFEARVQFGGGIRSIEMVERVLKLGVSRVVLGTVAVEQPQLVADATQKFSPDRVAVGIDARDGIVHVHGWQSDSGISARELAIQVREAGVRTLIFTDISRDGLGSGLNVPSTRALAEIGGLEVIASGGVHTIEDVRAASEANLAGVIIGRALYEGTIDLRDALNALDHKGLH